MAAAVTLFYCLFLFEGYWKLFRDSDTGWHIRTGESILASRTLPRSDPYSFSRAGTPWLAWEWGADVIMGAAHQLDGPRGVAWLYLTAIAASTWIWFRLHWATKGDFLLACLMASPMLSTVNLHWLARPHVFGWLLLMAAVWYAETARERPVELAGIALATALWANLHASFFLAPVVGLVYAAHHSVRPLLWDLDRDEEWRRARWCLAATAAAAAGAFLNPYTWRLPVHVWQYLNDRELLARVGEFQSFNFHSEGAIQILLGAGVAAAGGLLALAQGKVAHFLLTAGLLAVAMRSARGLPVAALVLLPLANGAITEAVRNWRGLRYPVRRVLDGWLGYSGNLRTLDRGLNGLALTPLVLLAAWLCLRVPALAERTGFPPDQFPVKAAAEVAKLPAEARLLAPDKFGGYLIYRFAGARKVFFDGRSDFYGGTFMKDYIRLMQVRPGWKQQVESWGFTHALLPNDDALAGTLETAGWRRLHRDETAILLARAAGE